MSETISLDRDGLSVALAPGTSVALRLPFENEGDSPGAFSGRLDGPGASYATLENSPAAVAGHGRGTLVVTFAADAPGRYELWLEVADADGYVVEPPGRRRVTMVVEPSSVPIASPAPTSAPPAAATAPADEPAQAAEPPTPKTRGGAEQGPAPVEPLAIAALPAQAVEPEPLVEPKPWEAAKPSEAPRLVEAQDVAQPSIEVALPIEPPRQPPEPPKPRVVAEAPEERPEPTIVSFKREAPPEPEPVPEPPKPRVEPPRSRTVVEMGEPPKAPAGRGSPAVRRERPYEAENYGKILRNPKTGDVLELAPGAGALVLIEFENKGQDEATYVLMVKDDLRPAEDFAYARTLLEQVNIRAGGTDELAFEIRVPDAAPPQTLRLRISYGRRDGGRELDVSRLTLKVSPRIAVELTSPKPRVVVGPLNRTPELALSVKNVGNVETTYRLTVKNPSDVAADARPGEYPDQESRDAWRFLFDKEAEDLRQDAPVAARLRLRRMGIWWLGWWETQRVKAVAVPVTDPRNAGREGNTVDLTGVRWRLLPAPWYIALPLLIAFFAVFVGAFGVDDVRVDNAIRSKANRMLFVLQDHPEDYAAPELRGPLPMKANVSWKAPFISLLKVVSDAPGTTIRRTGSASATSERTLTEYTGEDTFRVTSIIGLGGRSSEKVRYLPMRTTDKLTFKLAVAKSLGGGRYGPETPIATAGLGTDAEPYTAVLNKTTETFDGHKVAVSEKTVKIGPNDKLYVMPTNESGGAKVYVWAFDVPKAYQAGNLILDAANVVNESSSLRLSLIPKGGGVVSDDLWLLTSDSLASVFHLKIQHAAEVQQ